VPASRQTTLSAESTATWPWSTYAIETAGVAVLVLWVSLLAVALDHPASPLLALVPDPAARIVVRALALGAFTVGFVYSAAGRHSGAHLNPAITLAFYVLGRIERRDVVGYVTAQVAGGLAGAALAVAIGEAWLAAPAVHYAAPVPAAGIAPAFAIEAAAAFVAMTVVLAVMNHPRFARYTGLAAGAVLALFVILAAPVSGASFNPARGLATAVPAALWTHLWIYLAAPPLGALLAALVRRLRFGADASYCAKLDHPTAGPCHFRCRFGELMDHKP
jgi:aquaporin Z